MMRATALLATLTLAATAGAQTTIDSHGIRTPGAVIDASGVHTPGGSVDARGVHAASAGGGITILTNGGHRAVDCRGAGLTVNGNGNTLDVANCRSVVVAGNGNRLVVRFMATARLSVVGNHDTVTWRAPRGVPVSASVVGHDDMVHRVGG